MQITVTCPGCNSAVTLPEGRETGFCHQCGMRLEGSMPQQGGEYQYVQENAAPQNTGTWQNTEPAAAYYQPKNKKPRAIKAIIAAAALVAVAVIAFAGFTVFGASAYESAEAEFFSSLFKAIPVASENSGKLSFSLDYEPSSYLSEYTGIEDIALTGNIAYAGETAVADFSLTSGMSQMLGAALSYDGKEVVISLPDITDYYLLWTQGDTDAGSTLDFGQLDQKQLQKTIKNIAKAYFKQIEDYTSAQKGEKLSSGSVSVKCDVYTVEFTQSLVSEIGLAVIDEIMDNENLMDFIADYVASMGGSANDAEDILLQARDELRNMRGRETLFRMTVWVSGKEVVARKIDKVQYSDFELSYQNVVDGNDMHLELTVEAEGTRVTIEGDFEKSGGSWSGVLEAEAYSEYYGSIFSGELLCRDLKKSGDIITGRMSVSGSAQGASADFDIYFDKDSGSQKIRIEGEVADYYDTVDIGTVTLTYKYESGGKITLPKRDANYAVYIDDYSYENGQRAEMMANDLYDTWELDYYGYGDPMYEICYGIWNYIDDIVWYSDYSGW